MAACSAYPNSSILRPSFSSVIINTHPTCLKKFIRIRQQLSESIIPQTDKPTRQNNLLGEDKKNGVSVSVPVQLVH